MEVADHHTRNELQALYRREPRARIARRLLVVLGALDGLTADAIAHQMQVTDRTVHHCLTRYNREGLAGLEDRPGRGRKAPLAPTQAAQFLARIEAGPTAADGVCTLRGEDARRILAEEFGVVRNLQSTYNLLHKLGLSVLQPRPQHPDADPAVQEAFKKKPRKSSRKSRRSIPASTSKPGSKTKPASARKAR